jgi:WD40 repeat protein
VRHPVWRRTFRCGKGVRALSIGRVDDSTIVFAATDLTETSAERRYGVTAFDLGTGLPKRWNTVRPLALRDFQDKTLFCVAVAEGRDHTVLYAAGPFSFVHAWSLTADAVKDIGDYWVQPHRHAKYVWALSAGTLNQRAVVAAGNEEGILSVWDASTKNEIAQVHQADEQGITAIAFLNDNRGLISAGRSGLITLWSTEIKQIERIDIQQPILGLSMLVTTGNRVVVTTALGLFALDLRI